ncbi:MAG TPA: protoporphyrinogen oxidase, partial [Vicinamibacterales bacterium]|nr:protoporphyrinogen oxidase [Vicinamibacterales bacterium]
ARTISDGGYLIEQGPNGFLDRGTDAMSLVDELKLRPRLIEANPAARRRFRDLRELPSLQNESPPALMASNALGWRAKLRLLGEPWAAAPPVDRDETVFEFAERRLGREAAETFVDTAVAGISAGDSRALSVRSQFPVLTGWEREHGSLLKAMLKRKSGGRPRLVSFDGGMGTLTTALADRLNGAIRAGTCIERLEKSGAGWQLHLSSGSTLLADHVVCALPAHAAARVTSGFDRALAEPLAAIPYAGLSVVALAYRTSTMAKPLDGYGYLVKRSEGLSTLGVLCESAIFPNRAPDGLVLLRVMLGGTRTPGVNAMDDATVASLAVRELSGVLGVTGPPVRQWVCRWPSAIAQYTVGHESRMAEIRRRAAAYRGLHLCGTALDGVSFSDAIASARRAAAQVAEAL